MVILNGVAEWSNDLPSSRSAERSRRSPALLPREKGARIPIPSPKGRGRGLFLPFIDFSNAS
jgi:hypothetical protein